MATEGKKVCTKCGVEKSIDDFYVKDKRSGRRFARCKTCHCEECNEDYRNNLEENQRKRREYAAKHTEHRKVVAAAYRKKNAERLKQYGRDHYHANKEARAAYKKKRARENPEKVRQERASYRERNAEQIKEKNAEYREQRREMLRQRHKAWRDANPERLRAICRKWRQANKDMVNAGTHRRRCQMTRAGGSYTVAEWEALKKSVNYTCPCCRQQEPKIKLTVDHIKPVAHGGNNYIENIQPLCGPCNSMKGDTEVNYLVGFKVA